MAEQDCFLLTTGSTGGHIFPVLSLALKLKQKGQKVCLVSSGSVMEKNILAKHDFSVLNLPVGRLRKGVPLWERSWTLITLPFWMIYSCYILLTLKPKAVMGAGGAVSGPVLLMASLLRYPAVVWELNAVSGWTNKMLSRFVDNIFIQFESAKQYFPSRKCALFPFSARENIYKINQQTREPDGYFHVLILGGSQGSHAVNQAVLDMYSKEELAAWKIRHQTGEKDFQSVRSVYGGDDRVECRPFFDNMAEQYLWADVVVCRAGAGTLAELSSAGKAGVVIPLPSAVDHHQEKNALALSKIKAVEVLHEKDLNGQSLFEVIMSLNGQKKRILTENIKKLYTPDSVDRMADFLIDKI